MNSDALGLLLPIFAALVLWYLIEVGLFFNYIKDADSELWERLGRPSILNNNSPSNSMKFVKFIAGGDYKSSKAFAVSPGRLQRIRILFFGTAAVALFTGLMMFFFVK
jgi:hypothetical protein